MISSLMFNVTPEDYKGSTESRLSAEGIANGESSRWTEMLGGGELEARQRSASKLHV